MLLLSITLLVIKAAQADNEEISECTWITCMSPKLCRNVDGIVLCVFPNDAMKTGVEESSDPVSSANWTNPVNTSVFTISIAHSSMIQTELFPSPETKKSQEPLVGNIVTQVDSMKPFGAKTLPEVCWLPAVSGPCSKTKVLWYYNFRKGRCERFSFSGCGNANHFYSRKECEETCLMK